MSQAKHKHFHVWERGDLQVFSPIEAVIGYLRNEHRKTISDLSHDRCFAVLDAIGILCDLENNRPVEFMDQEHGSPSERRNSAHTAGASHALRCKLTRGTPDNGEDHDYEQY